IGYYIEINNELAAWGFVQTKGTYKYGSYFYDLPESVHMLKNLYVKPNYRGMSLGKKINEARINAIPEGCIPCVFVIPENKYAIRNLKLYGFQEQLKISHTSWFKKYTYTRLQLIHDTKLNKIIIKGFKTL
ncbi:MAG: GNAT family N-acetyltransferase, partial [Vicingaceae bacterium]